MRLHSNKYFVFLKNIRVFTCKGTAFAKKLCILAQNICVLMWKYWFPPITFSALSQNICVLLQKYCIPPRNLGVHAQESFSSHLILFSSQKFCKTSFSGGHKGFLRECKSINVHCSVWIRMSKGLINTLMHSISNETKTTWDISVLLRYANISKLPISSKHNTEHKKTPWLYYGHLDIKLLTCANTTQ